MNTFFIGDTHFGHRGIIEFEATKPYRPFAHINEHDEELIKRWNSVVRPKDLVWHLGDFCFGKENLKTAARLNGRKKLVLGNHDTYPTEEYLKYFEKVYGAVGYKHCGLTHIPVQEGQFYRWGHNIHGHLHTGRVMLLPKVTTDSGRVLANGMVDRRYINVSAEQINLTPISWDELKAKHSLP